MEIHLTPQEVAKKLQVSKVSVLKWLRSGKLAGAKIGHRTWRIRPEAVTAFLETFRNPAVDQRPLPPEQWRAIQEGIASIQGGERVPLDYYKAVRRL